MTVPRNSLTQRAGRYDLELTATLERPVQGELLRHARPVFAWFEVTPQAADSAPKYLHVKNLLFRPAPAWQLTSTPWVPRQGKSEVKISPALLRVDAYWLERVPPATETMDFSSVKAAQREFKTKATFTVDTSNVSIDLKTDDERRLTIRITHSPDKPVVVRVAQGDRWTIREDHLFFGNENKYTAIFGPFSPADWDLQLTLQFLSIASIKNKNNATRLTVDVPEPPDVNNKDFLPKEKLK